MHPDLKVVWLSKLQKAQEQQRSPQAAKNNFFKVLVLVDIFLYVGGKIYPKNISINQ